MARPNSASLPFTGAQMRGPYGTNSLRTLLVLVVSLGIASTTRGVAQALPPGFREAIVFSGLTEPTVTRFSLRVSAEFKEKLAAQAARARRSITNYLEVTLLDLWEEEQRANRSRSQQLKRR